MEQWNNVISPPKQNESFVQGKKKLEKCYISVVKKGIIRSHRDLNSVVDDMFRFHRATFYSQLKSKVGNILVESRIHHCVLTLT